MQPVAWSETREKLRVSEVSMNTIGFVPFRSSATSSSIRVFPIPRRTAPETASLVDLVLVDPSRIGRESGLRAAQRPGARNCGRLRPLGYPPRTAHERKR